MFRSEKVHPETEKTDDAWPIITYDQSVHKSPQHTLYQAARTTDKAEAEKKWNEFKEQTKSQRLSNQQIKLLIESLDAHKQWAALHYAVDANNLYVFDQLTNGKNPFRCDINLNGGNGENILHIAARSQHIWKKNRPNLSEDASEITHDSTISVNDSALPEIVNKMFKHGADVNDEDNEGQTPLHLAVRVNLYNYARGLIIKGADKMATTKLKGSVLYFALLPNQASSEELYEMVKLILGVSRSTSDTTNPTYGNHKHMICTIPDALMRKNIIGLVTLDNQTPLARALCHPQVSSKLVELLITEHWVDDKQLLVAFDMLARHREHTCKSNNYLDSLIPRLKKNYSSTSKLSQLPYIICRHNNEHLLRWFYENIIKKNPSKVEQVSLYFDGIDDAGYTLLLAAVFHKSTECVRLLFQQGESASHPPNWLVKNKNNENILHICAKHQAETNLFDIIWRNLLDSRNNKNKVDLMDSIDVEGNLPLQVAARFKNTHMYNILLEQSSNSSLNAQVPFQMQGRAAHAACQAGHLKIVQLIVWPEFDVDKLTMPPETTKQILRVGDDNEYTCLHLSATQGHKDIVDFLINRAKIEVNVTGSGRRTPLHLACENGRKEVVQLLLEAGASTTSRNAQVYNCLEVAIVHRQQEIVQQLFTHSTWREMMRNAQPLERTEALDTPMRKLIRYMPDMAIWLIDNKLTTIVGGPGQKVYKTTYDYEFYEDMCSAKDWYTRGSDQSLEPKTCGELWEKRGVEAIHTCWRCCCCNTKQQDEDKWYTDDAYTIVRNHPLFIVAQQHRCPELIQHFYHLHLFRTKFNSFGALLFFISFFLYMAYMGLFTAIVLMGKHPKFFYDKAQVNMTLDLSTCQNVSEFFSKKPSILEEALKTDTYKRVKFTLYFLLSIFILKNLIFIAALFPKVLRIGGSYIEITVLTLSYAYILDWFAWQTDVMFRCPLQYQLGAMSLLLAYINLLVYLRTTPVFGIGIFVVMLQVISVKFLRFLPVLLVIICGFGFTYWMLLQYQDVYGTPIEALMRTSLMLFDLGYENRLYDQANGNQGYYKLVYVIFMLTAITCSIFVINLLIGLAVGEIPSLMTQGTLWRTQLLFSYLSDYEILRIRIVLLFDCLSCHWFHNRQFPWFRSRLYPILEYDELVGPMGKFSTAWTYTKKHFFHEQIQDDVDFSNRLD